MLFHIDSSKITACMIKHVYNISIRVRKIDIRIEVSSLNLTFFILLHAVEVPSTNFLSSTNQQVHSFSSQLLAASPLLCIIITVHYSFAICTLLKICCCVWYYWSIDDGGGALCHTILPKWYNIKDSYESITIKSIFIFFDG